ncbi:DUF2238 domain-containing protein [Pasteurellaceae bacterium HPA106]|uniref:DUF2238 domain-containing protein n=1 Tax=Spirabiliibacterium pneumoniae TaxID=221400 RepID=UPI001AAD148A|nr:DUF2238 domain-containing protein [Spirabiliibacterium pneumoniae]MBE2895935.1 DUF2238 domain-containing protein [Spirabiliibacterium pneumoniae]
MPLRACHLLPALLCGFILCLLIWSGSAPYSRAVWYAEAIPIIAVFALLVLTYAKFQFSQTAYVLMSAWLIMHTIGAHYTFERVPFAWGSELLSPWLGEGRNHFDRVAHFAIGLYAYPVAELLLRKRACHRTLAILFGLFFIMSLAASYELIEWQYAVIAGGDEGVAFLGSQGDEWDAQKDILADTLGALTALCLFCVQHRND